MKTLTWLFATLAASSAAFLLTDHLVPVGLDRSGLSALALVFVAVAYLVYQVDARVGWKEWLKTTFIVLGFFLWAASLVWPAMSLLSDVAVVAFVVDVILSMMRWTHAEYTGPKPASEQDEPF